VGIRSFANSLAVVGTLDGPQDTPLSSSSPTVKHSLDASVDIRTSANALVAIGTPDVLLRANGMGYPNV